MLTWLRYPDYLLFSIVSMPELDGCLKNLKADRIKVAVPD